MLSPRPATVGELRQGCVLHEVLGIRNACCTGFGYRLTSCGGSDVDACLTVFVN